ncbi:LysR family transcriptional regulator [Kitasatospora viridis]|uniref:DNA-binding transcriptional LysR family regulator n=1 Tax=Kitasatospora viridis TaxID=281105 RepID=A0A561TVQ6_9ACTN|nr:LysR family transcriptional regulator [Kitasatospora viridis]TWF91189.1 DNA-binding transcriptional LysR family regulator [Kitasatospora viridis]
MSVLDEWTGRHASAHDGLDAQGSDPADDLLLRAMADAREVDDFDMRHLRYFLTVVRAGTVSAAAQELRISQPSLSQQIRRLERRIGATLFIRSSRGVELTASGRAFLREIQGIPGQLRSAIAAVAPAPQVWLVGVCGAVPAEVLIDVQNGLSGRRTPGDHQPGARVRMRSVDSADQGELLRHGEIAFGIVRLPIPSPHVVCAVVREEPLGVVMAREHPLAARPELTLRDLTRQRLLWYSEGCAPGFAESVPAQLARLGWNSVLHPVDQDQPALFLHALRTTPNLVALRPRHVVEREPWLVWRPLPTPRPPRERLAVTALRGSYTARVLQETAAERGWLFLAD